MELLNAIRFNRPDVLKQLLSRCDDGISSALSTEVGKGLTLVWMSAHPQLPIDILHMVASDPRVDVNRQLERTLLYAYACVCVCAYVCLRLQ